MCALGVGRELGIEKELKTAGNELFAPYSLLKLKLFDQEYNFWEANFPGGNDHGPGHVERVLEKLNSLLGDNPLERQLIGAYELYLCMMAILYHDIGLLQGREGHPEAAGRMLGEKVEGTDVFREDDNNYIFDVHDRPIIQAAVVSHGSKKDIEAEFRAFSTEEGIAGHRVRPRAIAALVRLADELDEDYRRAPRRVAGRKDLPEQSRFYWLFNQRISDIQPDQRSRMIYVYAKFQREDVGRIVKVDGKDKLFVIAFAEKLSKINEERHKVNRFLPNELQYSNIIVAVKPLDGCETWQNPRLFTFGEGTLPFQFVNTYPELLEEPLNANQGSPPDQVKPGSQEETSQGAETDASLIARLMNNMSFEKAHEELVPYCILLKLRRQEFAMEEIEQLASKVKQLKVDTDMNGWIKVQVLKDTLLEAVGPDILVAALKEAGPHMDITDPGTEGK